MGFVQEERENTYIFTVPSFTGAGLVEHGFTCRIGGISEGSFSSLNLGFHVGDDPEHVRANRLKTVGILGSSLDRLVAAEQVHGQQVHIVGREDAGRGGDAQGTAIPGTDALITAVPGIMLSLYFADCVPIFFFDPVRKVIGLAHAGWKGTVRQIAWATIKQMKEYYQVDPATCLAAIGPSIGGCCYRVDRPVYEKFIRNFPETEYLCRPAEEEQWYLDLPGANEVQLVRSGIRPEHITRSRLCTACRKDIFYSYRAEKGRTGRQGALIMLKERGG